jgi:hypothetical protein
MSYNIEKGRELRLQTSIKVMGKNIDLKFQTSPAVLSLPAQAKDEAAGLRF